MHAEAIATMNRLIRHDLDAIAANETAAPACEVPEVRRLLAELRHDHERHVIELGEQVQALGGVPAAHGSVTGLAVRTFAKLASRGDRSALMALRAIEELCARLTHPALRAELPAPARAVIERSDADEKRHRARLDAAISGRLWDTAGAVALAAAPAGAPAAPAPRRAKRATMPAAEAAEGIAAPKARRSTSKAARAAVHATAPKSPRRGRRPRVPPG